MKGESRRGRGMRVVKVEWKMAEVNLRAKVARKVEAKKKRMIQPFALCP